MNKDQFSLLLSSIQSQELQVREDGQKEYAHDESNVFANFDRAASELGIDRKKALWVLAKKHVDGIISYLNGHVSQREDIRGRIKDLRMYLALLWGMIEVETAICGDMKVHELCWSRGEECTYCEKLPPGYRTEVTIHPRGQTIATFRDDD